MIVMQTGDDPLLEIGALCRVQVVDGTGVTRLVLRDCKVVEHLQGPEGVVYGFEKD